MLSFSPLVLHLAVALGIGLLIGIDRERRKGGGPSRAPAGLRTFAITSLCGAIAVTVGGELLLAVVTAGIFALARLAQGRFKLVGLVLWVVAILATVAVEVVLLHREHYMLWFVPVLLVAAAACLAAIGLGSLLGRREGVAVGATLALALLLVAPTAFGSIPTKVLLWTAVCWSL